MANTSRNGRKQGSKPLRAGKSKPAGRSQAGPWSDYWVAQCKDGKVRRIGTGIQPLAHGVPGRVGMLRAYGNAIVPLEAAIFVQAAVGFVKEAR